MKKKIGIIIAFVLAICLISWNSQLAQAKVYTIKDVAQDDEAYDSIQEVLDQGWMALTLSKFYPDKKVTREEYAYILTKFNSQLKEASKIKKVTFKDITIKDKYATYIELQKKYLTYYKQKDGNYFKPGNYITREDALFSIVKILGYDTEDALLDGVDSEVGLDDIVADSAKVSASLKNIILVGVVNELIDLTESGDDVYLYPKKSITRRQLAMLLVNAQNCRDYSKGDAGEITGDEDTAIPDSDSDDNDSNTNNETTKSSTSNSNKGASGTAEQEAGNNTLSIDINGTNHVYTMAGTLVAWSPDSMFLQDKYTTGRNYFYLDLPDDIEAGDTLIAENYTNTYYDVPMSVAYYNKEGEGFWFGYPNGSYSGGKHKYSILTVKITAVDKKKLILSGTMEGKLILSSGEEVTFTNGVFKIKGEPKSSAF